MSTGKKERRLIETAFGDGEAISQDQLDATDGEELRRLDKLKTLLTDHGHREPPSHRRDHLWTRLEARLNAAPSKRRLTDLMPSRAILVNATALAVIALVTVVLLVTSVPLPSVPETPTDTAIAEIGDGDRLDTLINRATPLLMAVSNRSHSDQLQAIDIRTEQRLATRLADEFRALRETPDTTLERKDRNLVAELESVLMQVANTDPSAGGGEIALLRRTIEDRQLFFEFALRELTRSDAPSQPERSRDV